MSTANQRMRRHRERKRTGTCLVVHVAVTDAQVLELIEAGFLQAWDDSDPDAIAGAVQTAWNDLMQQ
jgi:hypothetical protein